LKLPESSVQAAKYEVAEFKKRRSAATHKRRLFQELSADSFEVIAQWQHYAIMELTLIEHFKSDVKWILVC
jgi:hypothetical protein